MEHHPVITFLVYVIEFQEREDQNCHSMIYTQHWGTSSHGVSHVSQHSMHCTTSKLSTKLAALAKKLFLIHNFNSSALTESMMQMAETFLVKCLKPPTDLETFDLLSLMALPLKWTSRETHSTESMQENISKSLLSTTGVDTSLI